MRSKIFIRLVIYAVLIIGVGIRYAYLHMPGPVGYEKLKSFYTYNDGHVDIGGRSYVGFGPQGFVSFEASNVTQRILAGTGIGSYESFPIPTEGTCEPYSTIATYQFTLVSDEWIAVPIEPAHSFVVCNPLWPDGYWGKSQEE